MTKTERIRSAYRLVGRSAGFYDGMMTCSTFSGRAVCRLVWGMGRKENRRYLDAALSGLPADFRGSLLEVPVGTGVLTMPVYRTLPEARVTCLDYAPDMLAAARQRAEALELNNVSFLRGDVGKLPFGDGVFDLVLSLNGFHAFPDKESAWRETFRVLKPGGIFCGCFYVAGENRRTDRIIRRLYVPRGFFTPPFETLDSLRARLTGLYAGVSVQAVESIACFTCRKEETA